MRKDYFNNIPLINAAKSWLTGMLFFIPFQDILAKKIAPWSNELSSLISFADEITIAMFLPIAIIRIYRNREISDKLYLVLLFPIVVLGISGIISGIVNGNSQLITILGIFDYIKNFLFIFIFAVFFREVDEFKRIVHSLLMLAVFLGVIALVQELWAMGFRYILKKEVEKILYLLTKNIYAEFSWRMGIYRAPSLLHNQNVLGLYLLLFLTIYLHMIKKVNYAVFILLFSGIFSSVSRMVYSGFLFIAGLQILKGRKWLILLVIPIVIFVFYMRYLPDSNVTNQLNLTDPPKQDGGLTLENTTSYREFAMHKSMQIWKDHPVFGVGPGMFGGTISIKFQSPVYKEYNIQTSEMFFVKRFSGLDLFWPQLLAEIGIIGTLVFAGIFISLFLMLTLLKQKTSSEEMRGLLAGLKAYIIVILVYTLGASLNLTSILFTYSSFVGMALGCTRKNVQ